MVDYKFLIQLVRREFVILVNVFQHLVYPSLLHSAHGKERKVIYYHTAMLQLQGHNDSRHSNAENEAPLLKARPVLMTRSLSLSDISTLGCDNSDPDKEVLETKPKGISKASPCVHGTTLLEPVLYYGVDKDEKEYVKKQHQILQMNNECKYNDSEMKIDNLTGFNEGQNFIEAGPALQVTSITIFNTEPSWKRSLVYGGVSITDSSRQVFNIYKRKPDHSDCITLNHCNLSLEQCPIAPVLMGKVTLSLFTKSEEETKSDCHILVWDSYVDYLIKDGGVNEEELIVPGESGYYAKMVYTIIPYATIIDVQRIDLVGVGPPHAEYICVEGNVKVNSINVLKNHKSFTKPVYIGQMFRRVIAVPVLSPVRVEISLTIGGTEYAAGPLESTECGRFTEENFFFEFKDINCSLDMEVDVVNCVEFFCLPMKDLTVNSDHYVEVFSVFVGGGGSIPALCGTIVVQDIDETVYIFSRNKECPDYLLRSRRIVSLTWPTRRVLEKDFYMHLKLKDVKGRQVCRGSLYFYHGRGFPKTCFERRMCAFIPGQDGYFAAVHYSIFRFGLQAKVNVSVECKGLCDSFDVYGSVYGEYNNHDYSSAYDKEYYRLIIFDRPDEYRANVINCSEIPLSKSLVTAPFDCRWLSVFVSLTIHPFMNSCMVSPDLFAMRNLRFTANTNASRQVPLYRRESGVRRWGCVTVKVDWL